jgi:hypothetical protein
MPKVDPRLTVPCPRLEGEAADWKHSPRDSFISCHPAASPSEDANPGSPATPKIPRPWASTSSGRASTAASHSGRWQRRSAATTPAPQLGAWPGGSPPSGRRVSRGFPPGRRSGRLAARRCLAAARHPAPQIKEYNPECPVVPARIAAALRDGSGQVSKSGRRPGRALPSWFPLSLVLIGNMTHWGFSHRALSIPLASTGEGDGSCIDPFRRLARKRCRELSHCTRLQCTSRTPLRGHASWFQVQGRIRTSHSVPSRPTGEPPRVRLP